MTNSVERVRIEPDGDVGIGCSNPASDLVIGAGGGVSCETVPFSRINAGSSSFVTSSSRTFKENLAAVEMPDILDRVAKIGVYTFDFVNGPKNSIGLMAEDFHGIFRRGSEKLLDGQEVQMALWLAVQELTARNDEQRQIIERQQDLIGNFEERLASLENALADFQDSRGDVE